MIRPSSIASSKIRWSVERQEQFHERTGLPLLLNTSFNRKGAPILRTAEQALAAAAELGLDALAVGDTLLLADNVPDPRATALRTR
ncbi:carbamoyltransferase C-terminal domain-containing protein [Streptomyces sp. AC512_CC834]|uniref:carbamoyltransferase C-terminal domain-containing protein n=1 Tax=Streptomyces sp. AC512_CC834 TaxID=2823691 RepID=UPI0027E3E192|nr:carbamoyltransferase C-terminal domain-containing protein [Streptomyces sp. AC512_CC834]